ncbi:MAG TPA: hypothetical protein QGF35_01945 [Dehalococcoidia bacterium]|nr:hypothetical protein [Dehalococcoidia bacterium]
MLDEPSVSLVPGSSPISFNGVQTILGAGEIELQRFHTLIPMEGDTMAKNDAHLVAADVRVLVRVLLVERIADHGFKST